MSPSFHEFLDQEAHHTRFVTKKAITSGDY